VASAASRPGVLLPRHQTAGVAGSRRIRVVRPQHKLADRLVELSQVDRNARLPVVLVKVALSRVQLVVLCLSLGDFVQGPRVFVDFLGDLVLDGLDLGQH